MTSNTHPTICVFGDSITWGANDIEGGWLARICKLYDKQGGMQPKIYNLGIAGNRVQQVLERIEDEARVRDPEAIVLAVGINDTPHGEPDRGTPLADFTMQYEELIQKAQAITKHLLIIGPTNVDESLAADWHNDQIARYNQAIEGLAREYDIPFVSVFGKLAPEGLQGDGLHPIASGHTKLARLIQPHITELIEHVRRNEDLIGRVV